jgi:hypothetical protein
MNPDLWSVFISHSTNRDRDGIARKVLERLRPELESLRFHVWVDVAELDYGDKWRKDIADGISTSHIGLVLLDEQALHRRWVQQEVLMMSLQPSERNYRIIPVLIGLTPEDVGQSGIEPFNTLIDDTQYVLLDEKDLDAAVEDLVSVLASRELGLLPDGEMKLVKRIAKMLPTDPAEAVRLAALFDGKRPIPPLLATEVLAHRMLEAQLESPVAEVIRHWNAHFTHAHPHFRQTLVNLIKPSWITLDEAGPIVPAQESGNRVGVLSTAPGTTPEPISVDAGVDLVRRATHCDEQIGRARPFSPGVPMGPEPEQLKYDLSKVSWGPERPGRTKYLVLEAGKHQTTRLDGVRRAHELWPNVVVVLVIGPDAESEDLGTKLGTSCYCRASLPRAGEEKAAAAIEEICEELMIRIGTDS